MDVSRRCRAAARMEVICYCVFKSDSLSRIVTRAMCKKIISLLEYVFYGAFYGFSWK